MVVYGDLLDGERIKGDTWYKLVDGEFKEVQYEQSMQKNGEAKEGLRT